MVTQWTVEILLGRSLKVHLANCLAESIIPQSIAVAFAYSAPDYIVHPWREYPSEGQVKKHRSDTKYRVLQQKPVQINETEMKKGKEVRSMENVLENQLTEIIEDKMSSNTFHHKPAGKQGKMRWPEYVEHAKCVTNVN